MASPPAGPPIGRLLVIDDPGEERQALAAILAGGYAADWATEGGEALERARQRPLDLILIGLRGPDLPGLDTCRRLKQDPRTQAIPVVFLCQVNDGRAQVESRAAGGLDCLLYPYQADRVLARVQAHIAFSRRQHHPERFVERRAAELQQANAELAEANRRLGREIEQRRQAEADLGDRLRFERMLFDLSARFINVPGERLDREIEEALHKVMEFFEVDRCGLLHTLPGKDAWIITHAAYSEFATPVPKGTELHRSINPWAYDQLTEKGEVVTYARVEDMPDEAHVDKQTWRDWGIRSNLTLPVLKRESIVHIISINAQRHERVWPEAFIPRLRLLGEILVNALERRQAEEALRESEERLNLAASAADAGLWVLHAATGRIWVTDKLRELLHFRPEEAVSFERFLEVVHPEDRERLRETMQVCLRTRELVWVEYRMAPPGGGERWLVSRGRSYPGSADQPERMMGVTVDVTARKEMEQRLREQLEEIRRLKMQVEQENLYLREEIMLQHGHEGIVGRSPAMKRVLAQAEQVAGTDATVLLLGETGTGKELLARTIHTLSRRKNRPLVTLNCAVLPPTLIESELFGREKGAYTGALTRMAGRFEVADGSTLFLDEIAELPPDLQAKLLRVLEEGRFERLGSTKSLQVNVRIIAATNRDLDREVAAGRFRRDLYYRLNVFPIAIPPLRERSEDIPPLVWAFVKQNEKKLGKRVDRIPGRSMEALKRYPWPGNARELRNIVEHAMITSLGGTLEVHPPIIKPQEVFPQATLEEVERRHILGVLEKTGWRVTGPNGAAAILGMKRTTLQSRMKRLGIQRPTA
jgi:PAS domain S-box-containing protein